MRNGSCEIDMTCSLTSHLTRRNLDTTPFTDDSFVSDSFVFPTCTLEILSGTEDLFTEKTTPLWSLGTIVNRLGDEDFSVGKSLYILFRCETDRYRCEIIERFSCGAILFPRIPAAGLKRIADYVGRVVTFDSIDDMDRALRIFSAVFGKLTDAQWRHMIVHGARQLEDGRYTTDYDPGIADIFKTMELKDIDLWPVWDAIRCPTLVLRGAQSDVLDHADAVAMTERGPKATLIEFPGMGHAPALMSDDQIAVVRDWLLAD